MGTGKVTVEHLGLKDCPRCNGEGNIESQEQQMIPPTDPMAPQDPTQAQPPQDVQPPQNVQTPEVPKKQEENPLTESKKKDLEQIMRCDWDK